MDKLKEEEAKKEEDYKLKKKGFIGEAKAKAKTPCVSRTTKTTTCNALIWLFLFLLSLIK